VITELTYAKNFAEAAYNYLSPTLGGIAEDAVTTDVAEENSTGSTRISAPVKEDGSSLGAQSHPTRRNLKLIATVDQPIRSCRRTSTGTKGVFRNNFFDTFFVTLPVLVLLFS
jgi:hypothetical protein